MVVASHHDHVADGDREAPVHFLALRHVGHAILVVAERQAVDEDAAAAQRQQTDQCLEQRGLAGAVGANDRHARAVRHAEGQILQDDPVAVADAGVLHVQTIRRAGDALCYHFSASTIRPTSYLSMSMYVGAGPVAEERVSTYKPVMT